MCVFGGCVVQMKEEVQQYKVMNNILHAEALKRVNDRMERPTFYEQVKVAVLGHCHRTNSGLSETKTIERVSIIQRKSKVQEDSFVMDQTS